MKKTKNNRRYYLHSKVKKFCSADTRQRTIFITEVGISELTDKQKEYLFELRDKFRYNLQYTIV